ncbi:MAG: PQQ-binding-like beta-propeller repeat protein [Halioglobus sp.]
MPRIQSTLPVYLIAAMLLWGCSSSNNDEAAAHIRDLRGNQHIAENEWRSYLGDSASNQFSPLTQITTDNVDQLTEAWRYDPGHTGLIPTNPLIVKGVLYGLDGHKNLFALNAATGEELWVYPFDRGATAKGAGRGLVYWEGELGNGVTAEYILVGQEHLLYAIDAVSGKLVDDFGNGGSIDLRLGLDRKPESTNVAANTPGTLYQDLLIMGFATSEDYSASPGYIRAYHLPSGELRWTFKTIPGVGEFGVNTWPEENRDKRGGANAWAGLTVDEDRGIVFAPTGSAGYDFYGANRAGDNLFANSLLALDARTGERLWHYQIVRHDLWDRDLPAPPNLVTIRRNGKDIPAVAQSTKSGHVFVFHRETGEPFFPIEEMAVAGSGMPGEQLPRSQPIPTSPAPFVNLDFEVTTLDKQASEIVAKRIAGMTTNKHYAAPSEEGIVLKPGLDGGAEWGGQAYDNATGLLYVNANEVPWTMKMAPVETGTTGDQSPETGYRLFCSHCHGTDRKGMGDAVPSLEDIHLKYWPWEIWDIVRNGRGRMPGFSHQPWYYSLGAIVYLYQPNGDEVEQPPASNDTTTLTYGAKFQKLRDSNNLPGSTPPWGSLNAVDLNTGTIRWRIPLGDYPQAEVLGLSGLGAENYGGPVVTAGGLVFIASTPDKKLRAFDKLTGKLLWHEVLPAAGFATPAVYEAMGRQFIVISAGGGKLDQSVGSSYIAYALPVSAKSR